MRMQPTNSSQTNLPAGSGRRAGAQIFVLVLAAFILGLVVGGYYYYRQTRIKAAPEPEGTSATFLSDSTQAILQRLDPPVDIKVYAPADVTTLPEQVAAFAKRVHQLLAEYERVGAGKIRLIQSDPTADPAAKIAAGAEGVLPFAVKNGQISYLGITVAQNGRKVTIAQLSPEWEAALESDLSRAIVRVTASVANPVTPAAQATATTSSPVDPAISEELLRTIPDLESRSFDEAAKILRESALAEFTAAVREMQGKVQETQKELAAVQGGKSEADQQAAMKQLQQVQSDQSKKLSEITARLQARIQVLERLKGVNRSAPK